jgi:hypothetical protein
VSILLYISRPLAHCLRTVFHNILRISEWQDLIKEEVLYFIWLSVIIFRDLISNFPKINRFLKICKRATIYITRLVNFLIRLISLYCCIKITLKLVNVLHFLIICWAVPGNGGSVWCLNPNVYMSLSWKCVPMLWRNSYLDVYIFMANMKTKVYTIADFTFQDTNHMWYHKSDLTAGQLSMCWP